MITIVNKYKHIKSDNDIYIGRGSILGNPYTSMDITKTKAEYQCITREESIIKYRDYLITKIKNKDVLICKELYKIYNLAKTSNVNLVCYCSPKSCHGDIIKNIIEDKIKSLSN